MQDDFFKNLTNQGFNVVSRYHAEAILRHDLSEAYRELEAVLLEAQLPVRELVQGGGGEAAFTQRLRRRFSEDFQWNKHNFEINKIVDGVEKESISHEVDHVRRAESGVIALEIEWNNKDPFFDRDLQNFKRLHAEGVISVGVIVTRGDSLQASLRQEIEGFANREGIGCIEDLAAYYSPTTRQKRNVEKATEVSGNFPLAWSQKFVSDKYGTATTHWNKLSDRLDREVGSPCPLLLIGLPQSIITV